MIQTFHRRSFSASADATVWQLCTAVTTSAEDGNVDGLQATPTDQAPQGYLEVGANSADGSSVYDAVSTFGLVTGFVSFLFSSV
jgi:hypothetical protein